MPNYLVVCFASYRNTLVSTLEFYYDSVFDYSCDDLYIKGSHLRVKEMIYFMKHLLLNSSSVQKRLITKAFGL